jgi:uncharacterized protein (TIGR00369 family)
LGDSDRPRRHGSLRHGAAGATAVSSLAVAENNCVEQGTITINLPYRAEFARSPDQNDYHGGIIATLIDLMEHACLAAKLGRRVPTIDMRVDYLRGAVDTDLTANARILRAGRSFGLVDVDVRDNADRAVATGRCVFSTREN